MTITMPTQCPVGTIYAAEWQDWANTPEGREELFRRYWAEREANEARACARARAALPPSSRVPAALIDP